LNKATRSWLGLFLAGVLVVAMAVFAVGCGTSETTTTTAGGGDDTTTTAPPDTGDLAEDQTLIMNINTEPPSLDPNLATDTTSVKVINQIFEGLVHMNYDGTVTPAAAESWEVSDDGLTYTFTFRGTDTWSNGEPVTSMDFKNSWIRILDPETAADYAYMLYVIAGAEEFNAGEGSADDVAIDASDPTKLVVTLVGPAPWFAEMTSHQSFFPIPLATVEQYGDKWTEPENIVTNGPYQLTEWNHESDLTIEKWTDHRMADEITLESCKMVMIIEATTGVAAFENNEIDIQSDLPTADMARLKQLPEYQLFPILGIYYLGYNTTREPLDNADVRKALALAIDRQSIIDNVAQADQKPALGFAPEGLPGFDVFKQSFLSPTADVAAAEEHLEKAGFPGGEGLREMLYYYNTSEGHQAIATAVQEQLRQVGVNVTLRNMEWKQYIDYLGNQENDFDLFRMGWVADFNDAFNFYDVLRGGGGNNYTGWVNDEFDQLLNDALKADDEAARWDMYKRMEEILSVEDMPVMPIYWYTNPELVKSYVEGYEPNPLGELTNLWTVKIKKQ